MSIFDSLGNNYNRNYRATPQEMIQRLRTNPHAVLKESGFSVPQDINDPHKIVNHLLQSGQIPNSRVQAAQRMMDAMGLKR